MRSMTDDKVKRRLTTVLCADVHGYSRLMGADEATTRGPKPQTTTSRDADCAARTGDLGMSSLCRLKF